MAFGSLTDPKFSEYKVGPLNLPADEMTITKLSDQLWGSRPREGNEMRALKTMVDLILNEEDLKTICSESFGGAIHGAGLNNHEPAPPGLIGAERKTQIVVNFNIEVRHQCKASPELARWQGGRRGGQAIRSGQDLPGLYIRRGGATKPPQNPDYGVCNRIYSICDCASLSTHPESDLPPSDTFPPLRRARGVARICILCR